MPNDRKTPMRKCTGCNQMKPKTELIRVARKPDGTVSVDLKGKEPGRGAYLCRDAACFEKAKKGRRFERAFSCRISDEIYALIEGELKNGS